MTRLPRVPHHSATRGEPPSGHPVHSNTVHSEWTNENGYRSRENLSLSPFASSLGASTRKRCRFRHAFLELGVPQYIEGNHGIITCRDSNELGLWG